MLNKIKNILKKSKFIDDVVYSVYQSIERKKKKREKRKDLEEAIKVPICTLKECGREVVVLNESKEEILPIVEVYGLIEGGECRMKVPKQSVWEIGNARVFNNSDIILTNRGAIWTKYYDEQRFDMTIFGDENVIEVDEKELYLKQSEIIDRVKVGYSLCGVYGAVWAHFLLLYLPKLYAYEKLENKNEKITIIMCKTTDSHINKLVENFMKRHDNLDLIFVEKGQSVECEKLYYIDSLNYFIEHSDLVSMAVGYFSKYAADLLKRNFRVEIEEINFKKNTPKKLFLERHTQWGSMENQEEVKVFFEKKGFVSVEPHKLSLEEKLELFYSAECIVGPAGSAFMNILFCKPKTKVLVFAPYTIIQQNPFITSYYEKYWDIQATYVCGKGKDNDIHGDYSVSLEKIKNVYSRIEKGEV